MQQSEENNTLDNELVQSILINDKIANISSKRLLLLGIVGFIALALCSICMPWLVTNFSLLELDAEKPNEIGDTIGGIMGPTVGLIGAALTFFAFWAQYDANLEQRKQFAATIVAQKKADLEQEKRYKSEQAAQLEKFNQERERLKENERLQKEQFALQDKRIRLEHFESKFYIMLSIHRDNVNGMDINGVMGRKVFLCLMDELRFLFWIFRTFYDRNPVLASPGFTLNNEEVYQAAYLSFFFGIGEKSTPLVKDLVGIKLLGFIENVHSHVSSLIEKNNRLGIDVYAINIPGSILKWEKKHTLGVGHLRRLSHYIRHLFQTVKFVDEQPEDLLTDDQKYNYISNLRGQLSTYEQLLLYYNTLSVLGEPWLKAVDAKSENYMIKYCMVKSMPINSADFYLKPNECLPQTNKNGKHMFEWDEIRERMKRSSFN